ncbi:MAG: hypothetical protein V2I51_06565, partial [Anderseniella sp.]|nr:hypothetical protein [Anderseniella sp.]
MFPDAVRSARLWGFLLPVGLLLGPAAAIAAEADEAVGAEVAPAAEAPVAGAANLGPELRLPSGNPAATDVIPGTGQLGRWLGLPADSPLRLGGVWVGNGTSQIVGGVQAAPANGLAQQLLLDASVDLERAVGWRGGRVWVQGLQVNAGAGAALPSGSVQGSNSLV